MRDQLLKYARSVVDQWRLVIAIPALVFFSDPTAAQNPARRQVGDPPVAIHGIIRAIYDYFDTAPQSLQELVKAADVIVAGTVESILPGRLQNVNDPSSVETDAIFAAERLLKGRPASLRSLVVVQIGGQYGDMSLIVRGLTPLKQADRHILFLNYDRRRNIVPSYTGTDGNFTIVAGSSGNFKIEGNGVKWMSASTLEAFKKFEADDAENLVTKILVEVNGRGGPARSLSCNERERSVYSNVHLPKMDVSRLGPVSRFEIQSLTGQPKIPFGSQLDVKIALRWTSTLDVKPEFGSRCHPNSPYADRT